MLSAASPARPLDRRTLGGGHRWSRQRGAIVDVLRTEATHLDANEIFEIARRHDPRLSLSTVYRTLAFLREYGVVRELRLGEGHCHYELQSPDAIGSGAAPHHSHLVCRSCGVVLEFSSRLLDRLRRELERNHGFVIDQPEMELSGHCQSCRPRPAPRGQSRQDTQ